MLLIKIVLLFVCFSPLLQQRDPFGCEYLPNKCRFKQDHGPYPTFDNVYEIFICTSLDRRFDFDQNTIKKCKQNLSSQTIVYFKLSSPEILDQSIHIFDLFEFLKFVNPDEYYNQIKISNLKGFDSNSTYSIKQYSGNIERIVNIYQSKFDFYLKNRRLNSCMDFEQFNLTQPKSLFQIESAPNPLYIYFWHTRFTNPVCPLIFRKARVFRLFFRHMTNTFYRRNFLKFSQIASSPLTYFDSRIDRLWIDYIEKIDVDSTLIDPVVFENTNWITLSGEIRSIHEHVFRPLRKLRYLFMDVIFFENLARKGIEWIKSINYDTKVNVSNRTDLENNLNKITRIILNFIHLSRNEVDSVDLFLDEDFCIFKDYPFDQLVMLNVEFLNFTKRPDVCLILWLGRDLEVYAQYKEATKNYYFLKHYVEYKKLYSKEAVERCEFEKKAAKCDKKNFAYKKIRSINDIREIIILVEYVFLIALPVLSLFGIITNIMVVLTLSLHDNKKHFKAKQYSYMRVVSVANIFVLLINTMTLLHECQDFDDIHCSPFKKFLFTQYFRIVCVEFLSSVLKLVSNLAYVGFSLSRLSLIGKDHSSFIKKFSAIRVRKFIALSITLSVLFSVVKLVRYQVNLSDPDSDYPTSFDRNYNHMFTMGFAIKTRIINIFNAISDITTYLVFVVVNFVLDVIMVVKLKRTLSQRMNASQSENQDVMIRVITSVISCAGFSLILKLPASAKSMFDSIHLDDNISGTFSSNHINYLNEVYCVYGRVCPMFEKLASLLFAVSISINLFFYKLFDKKFSIGFNIAQSKVFSSERAHKEYVRSFENYAFEFSEDRMNLKNQKVDY